MINVTAFRTAACALMLLIPPCSFAATSAKLHLTATVPPYVSLNATQRITSYQVRSEDLQRGYVDLPGAVTVTVRSNLSSGVPIVVDNGGIGQVLLRESGLGTFADGSFTLNTAGFLPYTVITKNLDSRIVLPADAREGVYPFAISVVSAL